MNLKESLKSLGIPGNVSDIYIGISENHQESQGIFENL